MVYYIQSIKMLECFYRRVRKIDLSPKNCLLMSVERFWKKMNVPNECSHWQQQFTYVLKLDPWSYTNFTNKILGYLYILYRTLTNYKPSIGYTFTTESRGGWYGLPYTWHSRQHIFPDQIVALQLLFVCFPDMQQSILVHKYERMVGKW